MLENSDAHLIQVFEEAVKNRHQVSCCELIPQNHSELVDGERQRPPHFPLSKPCVLELHAGSVSYLLYKLLYCRYIVTQLTFFFLV